MHHSPGRQWRRRPRLATLLFVTVLGGILVSIGFLMHSEMLRSARTNHVQNLSIKASRLSEAFSRRLSLLSGLKAAVLAKSADPDHVIREFDALAMAITTTNPGVRGLYISIDNRAAHYPTASPALREPLAPVGTEPVVRPARPTPEGTMVFPIYVRVPHPEHPAVIGILIDFETLMDSAGLAPNGQRSFAIIDPGGARIAGTLEANESYISAPVGSLEGWHLISADTPALDVQDRQMLATYTGFSFLTLVLSSMLVHTFASRHQSLRNGFTTTTEALVASEEKYRTLFHHIADAVILADADTGIIVEANRAAEVLWGYGAEDLVGMHQRDLHPPVTDEDYERRFREHVVTDGGVDTEAKIIRKDGTVIPTLVSAAVTNIDGQTLVIGVFRNISTIKSLETELQEMNRGLEERVEKEVALRHQREQLLMEQSKLAAMGELLGALAHEWRQPLNTVGLLIQNLPMQLETGALTPNTIQQSVNTAMTQIKHMSGVIDRFYSVHHAESEPESFLPTKEIGDLLAIYAPRLKQIDISVTMTCLFPESCTGTPTVMEVDSSFLFGCAAGVEHPHEPCTCPDERKTVTGIVAEFRQAVISLLTNARDAIIMHRERESHPGPDRIDITTGRDEGHAWVSVEDTGGGVPPEMMERIFEPYFTTKRPNRGTGLGLYAARIAVETCMDGTLTAENTDRGAKFTIRIPLEVHDRV